MLPALGDLTMKHPLSLILLCALSPLSRLRRCSFASGYTAGAGGSGCTTPCPAGTAKNYYGSPCPACAAGTYQPATGQQSCISCPAGQYQPATGQQSCISCPAGQYQPATGQQSCLGCLAGQYQPATGQQSCSNCPVGSWSPNGAVGCNSTCAPNFAVSLAGYVSTGQQAVGKFLGTALPQWSSSGTNLALSVLGWVGPANASTSTLMYLWTIDNALRVRLNAAKGIEVLLPGAMPNYVTTAGGAVSPLAWNHVAVALQFSPLGSQVALSLSVYINGSAPNGFPYNTTITSASFDNFVSNLTMADYVMRFGACMSYLTPGQMQNLGAGWSTLASSASTTNTNLYGACDYIDTLRGVPNFYSASTTPVNMAAFQTALQQEAAALDLVNQLVYQYWASNSTAYAQWLAISQPTAAQWQAVVTVAGAASAQYTAANATTALYHTYPFLSAVVGTLSPWGYYSGELDELMVFNVALTASSIQKLSTIPMLDTNCAADTTPPSSTSFGSLCSLLPSLVLYLPFDQWTLTRNATANARIGQALLWPSLPLYEAPLLMSNGPHCYPAATTITQDNVVPTRPSPLVTSTTQCSLGSVSSPGSLLCYLCPEGTYQSSASTAFCQFCPSGAWTADAGFASCPVPITISNSSFAVYSGSAVTNTPTRRRRLLTVSGLGAPQPSPVPRVLIPPGLSALVKTTGDLVPVLPVEGAPIATPPGSSPPNPTPPAQQPPINPSPPGSPPLVPPVTGPVIGGLGGAVGGAGGGLTLALGLGTVGLIATGGGVYGCAVAGCFSPGNPQSQCQPTAGHGMAAECAACSAGYFSPGGPGAVCTRQTAAPSHLLPHSSCLLV